MGNLGETLMEELNCETVFSIGGIGIAESVVVTWIIMAGVWGAFPFFFIFFPIV